MYFLFIYFYLFIFYLLTDGMYKIEGTMQNSGNVLIKPSSHQVKTILNQYVINKKEV